MPATPQVPAERIVQELAQLQSQYNTLTAATNAMNAAQIDVARSQEQLALAQNMVASTQANIVAQRNFIFALTGGTDPGEDPTPNDGEDNHGPPAPDEPAPGTGGGESQE